MQQIAYGKGCRWRPPLTRKTFLVMKMITLILFFSCLVAGAKGLAQNITISLKNAPLEKVFKEVERQSHYRFVYTKEQLSSTTPINIDLKKVSIEAVLSVCFKNQSIFYTIESKYILIKNKDKEILNLDNGRDIEGRVVNENGEGIAGVTVSVKNKKQITSTNSQGVFSLKNISDDDMLIITSIGYAKREIKIGQTNQVIVLEIAVESLDETVVMAYGKTSRRISTGNIAKVSSDQISKQPVSNPIATLQGRVPGLIVTQANGYANSPFNIQIRGQNSIAQGNQPFFIIDGVPFASQNNPINQVTNASNAGVNPFYTINPSDIESIEVLKDADATAIYGSRGANGVILITTKKGKAGKTRVSFNTYTGRSKVTRRMNMLNTQHYISMRKEAYKNDGLVPGGINAADILLWDSTRYTDIGKLLIGNTAKTYDINLSVSGGSLNTQFLISGNFHNESTVLPTNLTDSRGSFHTAINHTSLNKLFSINLSTNYSFTKNSLPGIDPSGFINRPPNMKLYDSLGNLNWQEGGVSFSSVFSGYANPLSSLKTNYTGTFHTINGSLVTSYALSSHLIFRTNVGANLIFGNENRSNPSGSLDPFTGELPSAFFANSSNKTWIIEPQVEYTKTIKIGKFNFLLGGSWQRKNGTSLAVNGLNYQNDLLLNSISGASFVSSRNAEDEYSYNAFFGRINYNWRDKYIINIGGRRDGSSRFGPAKRFSNFGSIGTAWIFSNEKYIQKGLPWLSFGKLRGSFGTTGNDAIGDYQFLNTWTTSTATYQGVPTIQPTALFNPELSWERNKKIEFSVDLGFLKQRILLSVTYYQNRSGNQLVSYNLPIQTGFTTINKNQSALIQNKGYEFTIETKNIVSNKLSWATNLNLTISRNKLLKFPGLSTSSYAASLIVGEPVSVKRLYQFLGVDKTTGLYLLNDINASGTFNAVDKIITKNIEPVFYGGLQNSIHIKRFEIDILLQFVKQVGLNYYATLSGKSPGTRYTNQPEIVLERWQNSNSSSVIQRFTTTTTVAGTNLINADVAYSDASFVRCKNVSLSYNFPAVMMKKLGIDNLQGYMHIQNAFTITKYKGGDPENQNLLRMPPLRTLAIGFQLTF